MIRTNCTDCLDRTNSAQTAFALDVLPAQVASLGMGDISPSVAYRLSETFKAGFPLVKAMSSSVGTSLAFLKTRVSSFWQILFEF